MEIEWTTKDDTVMHGRKEKLKEEGLFITEFKNEFFEDFLREEKEIVQEIEDLSKEYKKEYEEKCEKEGKETEDVIWCFIIKAALRKISEHLPKVKIDLMDGIQNIYLRNIVLKFYFEPLFFDFDVAQKIAYNLYRCTREEHDIYNLGGKEEGTEEDCEIVWEEYGKLFLSGRKIENKDPTIDLLSGLQKLQVPKSRVCFSGCVDGEELLLESDFASLNFLYLGNEKFQKYLRHEEKSNKYLDDLLKNIEILNEIKDVPLHYIWEKMTNYNTANIISKFVIEFISKTNYTKEDGIEFIESISQGTDTLLNQITDMPNVLTRLIFLKKVFLTISKVYRNSTLSDISGGVLCELRDALKSINNRYKFMQGAVLELSVVAYWKWNREQGKKLNIVKWIEGIEKEYSLDAFRKVLVAYSLEDEFLKVGTIHIGPYRGILKKYSEEYDMIHYEPVGIIDIIQCLGDKVYIENANDLAKEIQKKGWLTTESYYNVEVEESEHKYQYNEICFTETYNEVKEKKKYVKLKAINTNEHIENILKPHLLSAYKNIIFENINIEDIQNKGKEIINLLLYHIK